MGSWQIPREVLFLSNPLLASERSERDTYRGQNEKTGDVYLFV